MTSAILEHKATGTPALTEFQFRVVLPTSIGTALGLRIERSPDAALKERERQLQAENAHLRRQLSQLKQSLSNLTERFERSQSEPDKRHGPESMSDPWQTWIAKNLTVLEKYRGREIIIDYAQGVVLDAVDSWDLAQKLKDYVHAHPEAEERLLITQASLYLEE